MSKEDNNVLSAHELLQSRGIRCTVWEEWEKVSHIIPKTGSKQFEPSGAWLENRTIENGIKARRDLIGLEKVDRISQIASAEWLPALKKAVVTKRSGLECSKFGHEVNAVLYLQPEEALLLLEMNNMELYWNDVALSVQQAYAILLDSEFTIEHYRVYSQLARYGFCLQRCTKKTFPETRQTPGKKVIVEPENGLRMSKNHSNSEEEEESKQSAPEKSLEDESSESSSKDKENQPESQSTKNVNGETKLSDTPEESPKDLGTRKKTVKPEIVSDETYLDPLFKIDNPTKRPSGSRIQRNVKQLPKRNTENSPKKADKRPGSLDAVPTTLSSKKCRQEVIDISDDEVQEIPRPLTRMEILNSLPNIAAHPVTTVKINPLYIPKGVEPQKLVYEYERWKWLHCQKRDSQARNQSCANRQEVMPYQSQSRPQVEQYSGPRTFHSSTYSGYMSEGNSHQSWFARNTVMQNFCHFNQRNLWSNFNMQSMFNANPLFMTMQNIVRSVHMSSFRFRNAFQPNFQQNYQYSYQQNTRHFLPPGHQGRGCSWRDQNNSNHRTARNSSVDIVEIPNDDYVPTFSKRPNVSSWAELKEKWQEEKTITIDDEEPSDIADGDIQVVAHSIKPLLKPGVALNFEEIFEKLRIIKSAPERNVRQKKTDYSLYYNVFTNVKTYKKSDPGNPMCRVLIIRSKDEKHFDTTKLTRLQQEMKDVPIVIAHVVGTMISYRQIGFVSLPNLCKSSL